MAASNKKICLVASSGGHIEELMQLEILRQKYNFFFMVPKTKWTSRLDGEKYFIHDMDRSNIITKILSLLWMFVEQLPVFVKERPDVIVTTGAVVALPVCIYAKVLKKKIIFIESIARVYTPSKTGKILGKLADLFLVQWKEQLKCYDNATYGGWIY